MSPKSPFTSWHQTGLSLILLPFACTAALAQQDQCESVLRYAGMDESIVSNEVQRVRKFVSDFCSSNDSVKNAYNSSSQGVDVGFKGFSFGAASDSDSNQLSQLKSSMCSNQQQTMNDLEKNHREDRRATRESITAWENCMNRSGLAARATISAEKTVIVTISYRPISLSDTAKVFKPYDAESEKRCEYIGDPKLLSQDSFDVGPAAVNFVCRRNKRTDAMTIVLSANTAFINGTNPVIQVAPYTPKIELPKPAIKNPRINSRDARGGGGPFVQPIGPPPGFTPAPIGPPPGFR